MFTVSHFGLLILSILMATGMSEALASSTEQAERAAAESGPAPSSEFCTKGPIAQSRCIIDTILDDIEHSYQLIPGGGITSIRQDATWIWTVSLGREGHVDEFTYGVKIDNSGLVSITSREESTRSFGVSD